MKKIKDLPDIKKMNFNSYYDATRVPWRLSNDYAWYGDKNAYEILRDEAIFVDDLLGEDGLVDGYSIDGSPWKWETRDGFNNSISGKYPNTSCFISMYNCANRTSYNHADRLKGLYNLLWNRKEGYHMKFHYYNNTLRLLSLLFQTGRYINYSDLEYGVLRP